MDIYLLRMSRATEKCHHCSLYVVQKWNYVYLTCLGLNKIIYFQCELQLSVQAPSAHPPAPGADRPHQLYLPYPGHSSGEVHYSLSSFF